LGNLKRRENGFNGKKCPGKEDLGNRSVIRFGETRRQGGVRWRGGRKKKKYCRREGIKKINTAHQFSRGGKGVGVVSEGLKKGQLREPRQKGKGESGKQTHV